MPASPERDHLIAALAGLCREKDAERRITGDYETWLRSRGVVHVDLEAMKKIGAERALVYRMLVHSRIGNAIREFIPRTLARLPEARWNDDLAAFMADCGPRSPYLRDIPAEFVAWVEPRWAKDPAIPPYLTELARHELLALDVANDPAGGEAETGEALDLDRPLRFDGSVRLVHYAHAVHELPLDPTSREIPRRAETRLLVYRDRTEHRPRYLSLTPLAADVLEALLSQRLALGDAVRRACSDSENPIDDDKLERITLLLADLADRGVMLGAE